MPEGFLNIGLERYRAMASKAPDTDSNAANDWGFRHNAHPSGDVQIDLVRANAETADGLQALRHRVVDQRGVGGDHHPSPAVEEVRVMLLSGLLSSWATPASSDPKALILSA